MLVGLAKTMWLFQKQTRWRPTSNMLYIKVTFIRIQWIRKMETVEDNGETTARNTWHKNIKECADHNITYTPLLRKDNIRVLEC